MESLSGRTAQRIATRAPIIILPPEVVERIAAGEVIERPASVVRELVENALDAGATSIRVEIREGGLRLIRVADDGCGIAAEELELAPTPHATSKVHTLADLDACVTLGFRGEALASIASVAELEIASAVNEGGIATQLTLHDGQPQTRAEVPRGRGTTVTVRDLFARVPARRALLRGARAEAARVFAVVRAYALAHPDVSFTLAGDGKRLLQTNGSDLRSAIAAIYGTDTASALLPLPPRHVAGAALDGLLTSRALTYATREHVLLIVNGRPIFNRALLSAAEGGYRPLLRKGRHPLLIARLRVEPGHVESNIHPAKAEVLLRDEAALAAALRASVHEALASAPLGIQSGTQRPTLSHLTRPLQLRLPAPRQRRGLRVADGHARYTFFPEDERDSESLHGPVDLEPLAQFDQTLILARSPERHLFLVDQHRAHERILYERLRQQRAALPATSPLAYLTPSPDGEDATGAREARAPVPPQLLLEPLLVELTPLQAELLSARLAELERIGLRCEAFGGSVFLVRAVPTLAGARQDPATFAQMLLQDAAEDADDWFDAICISLACRSAIRRGEPLSLAEQRALLADLREVTAPTACPHGSPLLLRYTQSALHRAFEW